MVANICRIQKYKYEPFLIEHSSFFVKFSQQPVDTSSSQTPSYTMCCCGDDDPPPRRSYYGGDPSLSSYSGLSQPGRRSDMTYSSTGATVASRPNPYYARPRRSRSTHPDWYGRHTPSRLAYAPSRRRSSSLDGNYHRRGTSVYGSSGNKSK